MQNWTTIIPSASFNYTPCTDSTIEVSEVCILCIVKSFNTTK